MPQILIADDHPLFRLALAQAVRQAVADAQVIEAADLAAVREILGKNPGIDLVLLDLHMPGNHGLVGLATLRGEFPAVAVVMISAHDDPTVVKRALAFGAAGFIPKSAPLDDLQTALREILACRAYLPARLRDAVAALPVALDDRRIAVRLANLSPQQFRVLSLVAEGKLNKQIGDLLGIQERTVKAHMSAIFEKLGVRNRTQAGVLLRGLELSDPARAEVGNT